MHIFLIRHGESISNVGENYVKRIPDHLVSLTENGRSRRERTENGLQITAARTKLIFRGQEYGEVLIFVPAKPVMNSTNISALRTFVRT